MGLLGESSLRQIYLEVFTSEFFNTLDPKRAFRLVAANVRFRIAKLTLRTKRLSCIAASLVATTAWTDVLSLLRFTSNLKDPVVENTELVGLERVSTE